TGAAASRLSGARHEEIERILQAHGASGGGELSEETLAIALAVDPRVEQCDHAAILAGPYQSAKSLLEGHLRERQEQRVESAVSVRFEGRRSGLQHRIRWDAERDLLQHDEPQGVARNVDALPEAHRREQHRV